MLTSLMKDQSPHGIYCFNKHAIRLGRKDQSSWHLQMYQSSTVISQNFTHCQQHLLGVNLSCLEDLLFWDNSQPQNALLSYYNSKKKETKISLEKISPNNIKHDLSPQEKKKKDNSSYFIYLSQCGMKTTEGNLSSLPIPQL